MGGSYPHLVWEAFTLTLCWRRVPLPRVGGRRASLADAASGESAAAPPAQAQAASACTDSQHQVTTSTGSCNLCLHNTRCIRSLPGQSHAASACTALTTSQHSLHLAAPACTALTRSGYHLHRVMRNLPSQHALHQVAASTGSFNLCLHSTHCIRLPPAQVHATSAYNLHSTQYIRSPPTQSHAASPAHHSLHQVTVITGSCSLCLHALHSIYRVTASACSYILCMHSTHWIWSPLSTAYTGSCSLCM